MEREEVNQKFVDVFLYFTSKESVEFSSRNL